MSGAANRGEMSVNTLLLTLSLLLWHHSLSGKWLTCHVNTQNPFQGNAETLQGTTVLSVVHCTIRSFPRLSSHIAIVTLTWWTDCSEQCFRLVTCMFTIEEHADLWNSILPWCCLRVNVDMNGWMWAVKSFECSKYDKKWLNIIHLLMSKV